MQYFCPNCFAKVSKEDTVCPMCGVEVESWLDSHSYFDRLVRALKHPVSEVRMGAIISLGNHGNVNAAVPLADCAFEWPEDVVQGLEILNSLSQLPEGPEKKKAFQRLQKHPNHMVREKTGKIN